MSFADLSKSDADDMVGHARFLAAPSASSMAKVEPHLKRSIPVLIMIFLCTIFTMRGMALVTDRDQVEQSSKLFVSLLAASGKSAIDDAAAKGFGAQSGSEFEQLIFRALPSEATLSGRFILITDTQGKIIGSLGAQQNLLGRNLPAMLEGAQALVMFGLDAGVETLNFDGDPHIVSAAKIGEGEALVMVLQSKEAVLADWKNNVSLTVTVFALTATILIVLLYAYFAQIARRRSSELLYGETLRRVETALARGHCGLWDWNLAHGRIFWSRSMFEMLGYHPIDDIMSFGEIAPMVHPDDIDLFDLAQRATSQEIAGVDETIRMRHAEGHYVRLRLRTELAEHPINGMHLIGIAIDVTENHRLAEQNEIASQNLKAAIESTSESFVLWDANECLVLCNKKYGEYNGIPESALVPGAKRADIRAKGKKPLVDRRIPSTESRGKAQTYERQIEDGRWLQINERPTMAGGTISVGTDITQLKLQEESLTVSKRQLTASMEEATLQRTKSQLKAVELAELNAKYKDQRNKAEDAYKAKSEFLANVSHELRTPLNAIIGFSDIMKSGMFGPLGSERYDEYANDIQTSGNFLLGVINDILEMSKIEAGRIVLERETFDLSPIIEETTQMLSLQAKQKNISVEQAISKTLSINADRRAIKQVLINLVSNAVKFTEDGGTIHICAKVISNKLQITIADTGCGIPNAAMRRIGKPFEQVQNQFSKNHTGSGLGLAISKSLAELHGGSIRIRSKVDKGTVVVLSIPVQTDCSENTEAASTDAEPLPA